MKAPSQKKSTARTLMIVGAILAAVGLVACAEPVEMIVWSKDLFLYLEDLLSALAMLVGGGAMLGSGLAMNRSMKRYAQYLAVMGDRPGHVRGGAGAGHGLFPAAGDQGPAGHDLQGFLRGKGLSQPGTGVLLPLQPGG